jgi:hypothetical protein
VIGVDVKNFIYATEWNPFDLFRTLGELNQRYRESLKPLGETTLTVSVHASKLLSIGVLLAAYEYGFGVMHTTPTGYFLRRGADIEALRTADRLSCAWVEGAPYR